MSPRLLLIVAACCLAGCSDATVGSQARVGNSQTKGARQATVVSSPAEVVSSQATEASSQATVGSTQATVGSSQATVGSSQATGGSDSSAPAASPTVIPATPGTVLFDDFDGTTVDPAKWTVFDRLSDQTNKEVNCVGQKNVSVSDGLLHIVSKFEDRECGDANEAARTLHYTSGQIQQATTPFLYGTIDVRAKAPGGIGPWPAIWMLGFEWQASQSSTANVHGLDWPNAGWCEIDIAEFMHGERNKVNTTVHFNRPGGEHMQSLPFDATTRFMVYRLQWTQGSLVWSVDAEDGKGFRVLRSVTGSDDVPDVPMYLVINVAIGGLGGGNPDPASFPQTFQVDYARITQ